MLFPCPEFRRRRCWSIESKWIFVETNGRRVYENPGIIRERRQREITYFEECNSNHSVIILNYFSISSNLRQFLAHSWPVKFATLFRSQSFIFFVFQFSVLRLSVCNLRNNWIWYEIAKLYRNKNGKVVRLLRRIKFCWIGSWTFKKLQRILG